MPPFSGTQPVQHWQEAFIDAANHKQSLVQQAFGFGLAENVIAILDSVRRRLGAKWKWTWKSFLVALSGIEGGFVSQRCDVMVDRHRLNWSSGT